MLQSTEAFKRFANGKSWDQLSFQTQQQIRLMAILEQTSNKFGGEVFNNTNSSLQQLVAILKDVALNIGNAFLPIMNVVLPILSNFAMGLRTVTAYVASFMQTLFGYKPSSKAGIGGATGQVNSLGSAATKTGEKAKKAQKEVNRLLGGFDEINVLSKNSSSDSGSTGISTPTGGGVLDFSNTEIIEPDTRGLESAVNKFKTIFAPVIESFENLKQSIKPIVDNIGEILLWLWNNILVPFGTWAISDAIPAFFNLLSGALDVLNPILESFMRVGGWLWEKFLQPIAAWTGGIIVSVLNELADILTNIGKWMDENKSVVDAITSSVIAFFAAWEITKLLGFIGESGGVIGALSRITVALFGATAAKIADKLETMALTAMYAKDFIMSIINGTAALVKQATQWAINTGLKIADTTAQVAMNVATGAWNVICGIATTVTSAFGAAIAFLTSPIGLVIIAIGAIIAVIVLLIKNWDKVKEVASNVWNSIKDTWNKASTWFDENVVQPVSDFFNDMWEGIKKSSSDAWDWILGLFSKGGQIFSGVVGAVGDVFKTIVNSIIGGINTVIAIPFNKINGLLNKIRDVEVLGFTPFDGFWGYNPLPVPQIPKLAKGGIVDSATLAVVGEAGKEAVMPLENNTGWITELAYKLAILSPQQGSNFIDRPIEIILKIGDTTLGKFAADGINKLSRQKGRCVINV